MIEKVAIQEKPILFSGAMVRAILDGKKTQTRRVIKPQPFYEHAKILGPEMYSPIVIDRDGMEQPGEEIFGVYDEDGEWGVKCPYGQPGDHLWVKETFTELILEHRPPRYVYKADMKDSESEEARQDYIKAGYPYQWHSSIFMPRWASRIALEIEEIGVERLQDITPEDAIAEGCFIPMPNAPIAEYYGTVGRFHNLWNSINAKPKPRYATVDGKKVITHYESFPWEEGTYTTEYRGKEHYVYGNPWLWVVSFQKTD